MDGNSFRLPMMPAKFNLTFEFSNRLLGMAFGKIFSEVTARMVDAFAKRAKQVYG